MAAMEDAGEDVAAALPNVAQCVPARRDHTALELGASGIGPRAWQARGTASQVTGFPQVTPQVHAQIPMHRVSVTFPPIWLGPTRDEHSSRRRPNSAHRAQHVTTKCVKDLQTMRSMLLDY